MGEIWERLEDDKESYKSFAAFKYYRDTPIKDRSLAKCVHAYFPGLEERKYTAIIRQWTMWSTKYHWVERVKAWEREQDRIARAEQVEQIKAMTKRHVSEALKLQELAIKRLASLDPKKLSPGEVLRYFVEAAKLERLSLGLDGTGDANTNLNVDLAQLSVEQLQRIANGEDIITVLATTSASGT